MPPDLPSLSDSDALSLAIKAAVDAALAEDVGQGDVTSNAVIPKNAHFKGTLRAREDMVVAGMEAARVAFLTLDKNCTWTANLNDGDAIKNGTVIASVEGNARALLASERTALNILQHLSGIATTARRFVDAIEGTTAQMKDTRKTIPGLRLLAKYAVRMGGAVNHRMGLDDAVLIKDNHIAIAGDVKMAVAAAKKTGLPVQVECDTLDQVSQSLDAGADSLLLDNMKPDMLRRAVDIVAGQVETEASGGVKLDTVRAIAETGVTFISSGFITQSSPATDIGLDWETL